VPESSGGLVVLDQKNGTRRPWWQEPSGGTLIAYAAKDGEEAIDGGEEAKNSPFAAALIKHLTTRGLEVGRLFRLVRDDVLAATDHKQEPFVYGSLPGEELFFRAQ
jgi:uncharacterized caspase-like protein